MDCSPPSTSVHEDSPGKNTGVGCHALLQRIFPTQGLNPGLPHCRQILYHLNHQEYLIFSIFSYANGLPIHPLLRNVHSSPLLFNWIANIFIADVQEILFWISIPYEIYNFQKYVVWFKYMIFSHSVDCISLCWQCPWIYKSFKFWLSPAYLFFSLVTWAFSVMSNQALSNPMSRNFAPIFFYEFDSFISYIQFLIYFQLIFTYDIKNTIFFFNACKSSSF